VDYFNPAWLRNRLESGTSKPVAPEDVQATLAELTAASIASALPGARALLSMGGVYLPPAGP
jgi:1,6-anhydro-N-acetylmuramate kinase